MIWLVVHRREFSASSRQSAYWAPVVVPTIRSWFTAPLHLTRSFFKKSDYLHELGFTKTWILITFFFFHQMKERLLPHRWILTSKWCHSLGYDTNKTAHKHAFSRDTAAAEWFLLISSPSLRGKRLDRRWKNCDATAFANHAEWLKKLILRHNLPNLNLNCGSGYHVTTA